MRPRPALMSVARGASAERRSCAKRAARSIGPATSAGKNTTHVTNSRSVRAGIFPLRNSNSACKSRKAIYEKPSQRMSLPLASVVSCPASPRSVLLAKAVSTSTFSNMKSANTASTARSAGSALAWRRCASTSKPAKSASTSTTVSGGGARPREKRSSGAR